MRYAFRYKIQSPISTPGFPSWLLVTTHNTGPIFASAGIHPFGVDDSSSRRNVYSHRCERNDDTCRATRCVTRPLAERVRPLFNILGAALQREAGISLHIGTTRVWNRGGIVSENVEEMGPDVWNCDGIKVMGGSCKTSNAECRSERTWRNAFA